MKTFTNGDAEKLSKFRTEIASILLDTGLVLDTNPIYTSLLKEVGLGTARTEKNKEKFKQYMAGYLTSIVIEESPNLLEHDSIGVQKVLKAFVNLLIEHTLYDESIRANKDKCKKNHAKRKEAESQAKQRQEQERRELEEEKANKLRLSERSEEELAEAKRIYHREYYKTHKGKEVQERIEAQAL